MTGYHTRKSYKWLSCACASGDHQTTTPPQKTKDEPDAQGGMSEGFFEISRVSRRFWAGDEGIREEAPDQNDET